MSDARDEVAARLAAIVESSDDAIVSKTLQGVILTWNRAAERIFGYAEAEAVGRHITLIIPEERRAEEDYVLGCIARGESVRHFETVRVAKDGRRLAVSLTVSPVRNAAGEIVGASKIARDITDQRRIEEAAHLREAWFATALRSIGDAVITTDAAGAVTFLNPSASAVLGWTSAEAEGRPLREVFPVVDEVTRCPVESPVERVLREGAGVGLGSHRVLLRRDGTELAVDDSAAPIRARDGALAGVILVFRDVSRRRRADARSALLARATEALASSLDYDRTLEAVASLVVPELADWAAVHLVRDDGVLARIALAHTDPAAADLLWDLDRRYPGPVDASYGPARAARSGQPDFVREVTDEVLAGVARSPEHLDALRRLALRSYIAVPMRLWDKVIGVLSMAASGSRRGYDDDDLRFAQALADRAAVAIENARLFRAADLARAEAEAASRAKDEFLAMLGHELRNPLAPIVTAVSVMNLSGETAFAREREVIARQLRHVTRLVDDLLDVARITRGKVDLALERVEVGDAIARAAEIATPLLERARHRLRVDVAPGLAVRADATRLAQVLGNLLTNAAKYTPDGGLVEVTAREVDGAVEISVRDNGAGIAPELLPWIFGVFVQGRQPIDRREGGLGIGLAIVQSLVRLHGGEVVAESEGPGRGSCFRLRLPALSEQPPRAAPPPSEAPAVLVVDGSLGAARQRQALLEAMGCRVVVATDAPTALEAAAREAPALAIVDLELPVMDGYELARRLREVPGLRAMALIAVEGYAADPARDGSRGRVFDACLAKPVDPDALRERVRALLATSRA